MLTTIYYNGAILTLEDELYQEAVLIKNGKIEKVGTKEAVMALKEEDTTLIDLKGKCLMPAFIDSHSHFISVANTMGQANLLEAKSFDDIVEILKQFIAKKKPKEGEWLIGFGYDHNFLKEQAHPTKEVLDKVSKDIPILICHTSLHMGVANSKALSKTNITENTADPVGGHIGRMANSKIPNGYLEESAFISMNMQAGMPDVETLLTYMNEAEKLYLKNGITTVQDGLTKEMVMTLLKSWTNVHKADIDLICYADLKEGRNVVTQNPDYVMKYKNRLKIGGYKIFLDGSPQGKTAWMTEPYENGDGNYRGYPTYEDSEVKDFAKISLDDNLQLLAHCNGDAAAQQLIRAFQEISYQSGQAVQTRPVMIHAQTVREDQIQEMAQIPMIASFFVAHVYYWGDVHMRNLGKARAEHISPVRTAINHHLMYTLHQDAPVIMPDMLFTIWCAANRVTKTGMVLGEDERISVLDAIKGVTLNAAYQYFEEDIKGSIKEGKLADLIILDQDPLKVPKNDICKLRVLQTIKEGKIVYQG